MHLLVYRPEELSHDEFIQQAKTELNRRGFSGIVPFKISHKVDNIYCFVHVAESLEDLCFESLLFPLTTEQLGAIRTSLDSGILSYADLLKIDENNIIDLTYPIDAPLNKRVDLKDIGPEEFEKRVANLIKIIEEHGASVNWNHKTPDPSNNQQDRQIDIEVKKNSERYHIECRHRNKPQDVQWIEQLIGRKARFNLDGIAAVSSSGFTKTAKLAAQDSGVILRSLTEFNEHDSIFWIDDLRFSMIFLKLERTSLTFQNNTAFYQIKDITQSDSMFWAVFKNTLD